MVKKRSSGKKKAITLRDVISHIQGVKSELSTDMQHMEQRLTKRIDDVESNLMERIDGLGQDIMATAKDSLKIRRHVGMAIPEDD
ncbi:MAG: hypothetical protein HOO67_07710 [Candidatus Peribacteraceae bacterium]|nr:hypothetical protein [Candidatus Peribacteraceae bacterium]